MNTLTSAQLTNAQFSQVEQQLQAGAVYTDIQSLQKLKNTGDKDTALKQVAQQFESMFLHMMLKSMRDANAVFEQDSMFGSSDEKFYRDMYDHQLSLTLAQGASGGVGIASAMYRQLKQSYGTTDDAQTPHTMAALPQIRMATREEPKSLNVHGEIAEVPKTFVDKLMPAMRKAAHALGIDAHLLLAQAALETGWGKHVLSKADGSSSFNLFNIKVNAAWQGDSVAVNALEYRDGTFIPQQSTFKAYESLQHGIDDYVGLVKNNPRYANALRSNGESYIRELQEAGYATDPEYADKVLSVRDQIIKGVGITSTHEG